MKELNKNRKKIKKPTLQKKLKNIFFGVNKQLYQKYEKEVGPQFKDKNVVKYSVSFYLKK